MPESALPRPQRIGGAIGRAGPCLNVALAAGKSDDSGAVGRLHVVNGADGQPAQLAVHPIVDDYADLTDAEVTTLRESLRSHGLRVPVVIWNGQLVDGRHRATLCQELGIEVRCDDVTNRCPTEEEMRAHVRVLNEYRRANTKPLTTAEKQARIEAALRVDPERSNRAIAKQIGVSHTTVGENRQRLERKGVVESSTLPDRKSRTGNKGEGQRRTAITPIRIASRPKRSLHNGAIALNSLSWSDASPELRRKFIDGVGLKELWESASQDQRALLRDHIEKNERGNEIVISAAAPTVAPESDDPFAIPTFLRRPKPTR